MRVEELITNPRFIRWALEGREDDRVFWENWLREHPGNEALLSEARTLLRSLSVREADLSPAEIGERIEAILRRVREGGHRQTDMRVVPWRTVLRWTAAALLVGVLGMGVYLSNRPAPAASLAPIAATDLPPASDSLVQVSNEGPGRKIVQLADGSNATLYDKSIIRYSSRPGSSLDIYLSGEAEFSVAAHANRPFRVFTHGLVTRVLGTRFRVRSRSAGDIRVTVLSGKVSVSGAGEADTARVLEGVVLTANQELIYGRDQRVFKKVLVDTPVAVHAPVFRPDFHYDNAPVADVLEDLKATFALDIVYDKETLKNCRISADLSDESIYKKLDLICQAMDAHYEVIDGVVTIQAKPCQ